MRYKLGIIGCGVMGMGIFSANSDLSVVVYDVDKVKEIPFAEKGADKADSAEFVIKNSDYILIAIKPQQAEVLFRENDFSSAKVVISIMAGIKLAKLRKWIASDCVGIVRVMPNLPIMVKKGTAALAFDNVSERDKQFATKLFSNGGVALPIDEKLFDAVTAVSGSGPAYVYMFIEAMAKGGVANGLSYEDAKQLAIGTVIGAASFAQTSDKSLADMVDAVCSKGGTTIEAVNHFKEHQFEQLVIDAETKAALRSEELSK